MKIVERGLTVPKATIGIDGGPRWPFPEGQLVIQRHNGGGDPAWINTGATFGIAKDFHLGLVIPFQVAPDPIDLHDPRVHMIYSFIEGVADIGVFVQGNLPFEGHFQTMLGFPMQFELGRIVRLDTGPFFETNFREDENGDSDVGTEFRVPLGVLINVSRSFFMGPELGLASQGEFDYWRMPLGYVLGYSIGSGRSLTGDLSLRFRDLNARDFGNAFHLIFAADLFFDLG